MKQIAGRYKVIEKLGTGLSGTVFSVKDGPRGPTVALKLSNPTEDSAHHLEKEFFRLFQLDHPNIVDDREYLVYREQDGWMFHHWDHLDWANPGKQTDPGW
ncbi:hypothetical protein E3J62_02030 [candidate division TA06 bacterium]|uniref:Protein kinase domain-containing protein n=1 Tax=candidate division TA06 bacterium TaxID=2250710 RepID=A0A523UXI2_UNCT6|nr:MAG: hypothetical protein E3J62_02030 [candidate division TA06 bacterium]